MFDLIKSSEWLQVGLFVMLIYIGIGIKNLLSNIVSSQCDDEDDDDDREEVEQPEIMDGMTVDGVKNMMSAYERHITRLKNKTYYYVGRLETRNKQLRRMNDYLNELRDNGRVTKDELEVYFKKDESK